MYRIKAHRLIASTLVCLVLGACAKQASFEENYAKAKANASAGAGATYDQALGNYMSNLPGYMLSMQGCVLNNPSQAAVHGYLEFESATAYKVVLEPKGGLATCITTVLENRTPPPPPSTPYLNPFEFQLTNQN
jgi:hypothetical protein